MYGLLLGHSLVSFLEGVVYFVFFGLGVVVLLVCCLVFQKELERKRTWKDLGEEEI